jgi:hypothetical protein
MVENACRRNRGPSRCTNPTAIPGSTGEETVGWRLTVV